LKDGDKSLKPENLEAVQSGEELFVTEMHWMGSDGCIEGVQMGCKVWPQKQVSISRVQLPIHFRAFIGDIDADHY